MSSGRPYDEPDVAFSGRSTGAPLAQSRLLFVRVRSPSGAPKHRGRGSGTRRERERYPRWGKEDFLKSGARYDLIFDAVPMAHRTLSLRGREGLTTTGTYISVADGSPKFSVDGLTLLRELVEAGRYRPVMDRTYPLEEIVEAHRYVDICWGISGRVTRLRSMGIGDGRPSPPARTREGEAWGSSGPTRARPRQDPQAELGARQGIDRP